MNHNRGWLAFWIGVAVDCIVFWTIYMIIVKFF